MNLSPIEIALLIPGIVYCLIILFFWIGILREQKRESEPQTALPKVSVLIPARNESANIVQTLASLAKQTYPPDNFEVIIIDDRSTDGTAETVEAFIRESRLTHFRLISHDGQPDRPTFKKDALAHAITFSTGEIIMTTDADCQVQPDWIAGTVRQFDEKTGMVAGLITFDPNSESTLFHKLQTLEFAGLVFAGVGANGNRYPLICNGANLAYRRAAFEAVGGFAGHAHIPSGDDDLFMQYLHHHTNWQVRYNLDPATINYTQPVDTLRQFINQRARWGSKSREYPGALTFVFLLIVYLFYVMMLGLPMLWLSGLISGQLALNLVVLKIFPEYLVIRRALDVLQRQDLLIYFFIAELAQIPYIVIAGFAGFFKLFRWK